jgi:hypothetical protein
MTGLMPIHDRLRPFVETFVPATSNLTDARYLALVQHVDERLATEPPALTRQLRTLVLLLHYLPIFLHFRTFDGLSAAQRQRFLERVQDGPVALLRVGVWGLRTLVFVGWYADPEVGRMLGWRANPRGWAAFREQGH